MHLRRYLTHPPLPGRGSLCWFLLLASGCGTAPVPGDLSSAEARTELVSGDLAPVRSPVAEEAIENSDFAAAQPATLPASGEIIIEGTIDSGNDIDLYALGPALRGDRITIEVNGYDGLNTVAALFDGYGDLIDANDDRSFYGGLLDPYVSRVVREDVGNLFLGIAVTRATHFASSDGRFDFGSYTVKVKRKPSQAVTGPEHQLVYLNFEGGDTVQIGLEPSTTMLPFSAESISSRLTDKTEDIINMLIDHMKQDYASYNVTLLDSRHHGRPDEPHTKLFFGNFNSAYLGLADNVDTGNRFLEQEAIIYAEDMSMFESLVPSAEEVAMALANIGSHELGHLLGLEHTAVPADLMSTAATARQILENDASFLRSRLHDGVFPAGFQNNPVLLLRNVGPNPVVPGARLRLEDLLPTVKSNWRDEAGLADIPIVPCGRCAAAG